MIEGEEALIALKASVYHSAFDGGVVFRGGDAPILLRGEKAHKLVAPIVAEMRRGTSRSALLAKLPESARPVVAKLLDDLDAVGLLRKRAPLDPRVEERLAPRFANLWQFLADNLEAPGEALRRWREQIFYVTGEPRAVLLVVRALAESAATRFLLSSSVPGADLAKGLEAVTGEFPEITIERAVTPPEDCVKVVAGGAEALRPELAPFADAWVLGQVVGHIIAAKIDGPVANALRAWEERLRPPSVMVTAARLPDTRVSLAAALAAFGIFCDVLDIGKYRDRQWLFVAQPGLKLEPIVLPEPIALHTPQTSEAPPTEPIDDVDRLAKLECLTDPVSGFLDPIDDIDQVPLSIARFRVRGVTRAEEDPIVSGTGLSQLQAQLDGYSRGIAAFLANAPALTGRGGQVGVGWTWAEAREDAARRAFLAGLNGGTPDWQPLDPAGLHNGDGLRLRKLLALITGEAITLERSAPGGSEGAAVRVLRNGQTAGVGAGRDVEEAARRALAAACTACQFGEAEACCTEAVSLREMKATGRTATLRIELGYAPLAGFVHCCLIGASAND